MGKKTKKMGMVHLRFTSFPGGDINIITKSVSKHGHPGLRGTNHGHTSTELSHVGHCDEILGDLIGRNKIM
jgi:hypothetical protein